MPVPLDDLPDELRPPTVGAAVPLEDLPEQPKPGFFTGLKNRATATLLGLESGVPFGRDINAAWSHLITSPEKRRELAAHFLTPQGQESWLGMKPEEAAAAEQNYQAENAQVEQAKNEAWKNYPGEYGSGKVIGFALTDKGLGAAIPGASYASTKGLPLGQRLGAAMVPGAIQNAAYSAGDAPNLEAVPEAAASGAEFGAAVGPLFELGAGGVGRAVNAVRNIPNMLKRAAEQNAIRAMGAPGAVGKLVAREGAERVPEVARQILDEGVPLKSPGDALRAIKESLGTNYGPALASLTSQAKQAGARFNLGNVIGDFQSKVPELMKDPQKVPIINAVQDYLMKVAQNRGIWTPDQRLITELAPNEAWQLRQNLDTYLRGVQKNLDPSGTLTKSLFNDVRHSVDRELSRAMSSVGLGEPWAAANSAYRNLSAGQKLAKAGVVQEAIKEAGPGQSLMSRLKELRLPGPAPATKAKVQNTLYRLMSPKSALDPLEAPPWNPGGFAGAELPPAPGSTGLPGQTFQPAPGFEVWRPPAGEKSVLPQQPSTYVGPERRSLVRLQADLDAARREAILRALSKE